ncbi:hypothetical protein RCC89_01640 [Cytophagaceae bacterium ABcell3]|nr:hypothetical protein RCC89_01640 [Cytophagaceae bacterium ABcell3]
MEKKKVIPWKENKIISIETRKGTYVIAQMLKSPYLRFYNTFMDSENWGKIDLSFFETLFVNSVTKQFLQSSNISVVKDAIPDLNRELPKEWIQGYMGNRKVKVWAETENEREFIILGDKPGGSLISRDISKGGNQDKKIILHDIPLDANNIIDEHELTGLCVFPLSNERLFLCHILGKNVDPNKDLIFDRSIPLEYKIYIDIKTATGHNEKDQILNEYYY